MSSRSPRYERSGSGLQFDRVAFFSDAVYAIAMTLLVVGIGIPDTLDEVFDEKLPEIIGFFIGFVVLANFWIAHHRFFASLRSVDLRLIQLNLVYLAAIAFLPFPIGLLGEFEYATSVFLMFVSALGAASLLEAVMLTYCHRTGLFERPLTTAAFQSDLVASMIPVLVFAASVPIAFWNTSWALFSWLLVFPLEALAGRWAPDDRELTS